MIEISSVMEEGSTRVQEPHVTVLDCSDRDYTVVTIRYMDRPKLLFDTICTLTDMEYVVFHGTVITGRVEAYQTCGIAKETLKYSSSHQCFIAAWRIFLESHHSRKITALTTNIVARATTDGNLQSAISS